MIAIEGKEVFKDIQGYEGKYMISNLGNVFSVRYDKIMRLQYCRKGYLNIRLSKNSKYKMYKVHRLVAEAFIHNEDNKPFVNHINGVKDDNKVENLEWVTAKENTRHAWDTGLAKPQFFGRHIRKKSGTAVIQYDLESNEKIGEFDFITQAAEHVNISPSCVTDCCNGLISHAGGYKWRYRDKMSKDFIPKNRGKEVYQITLEGQIIKTFNKVPEVMEFLNRDKPVVIWWIKNQKPVNGTVFVYKDEYEKYLNRDQKPVKKINLKDVHTKDLVGVFDSVKELSDYLNLSESSIRNMLNGYKKTLKRKYIAEYDIGK